MEKIFKSLLVILLAVLSIPLAAQTTTWTAARPGSGADNTSSWYDAANWNNGVPDATKDVIIPAGLNTCYIPDVNLQTPRAKSITVQNDAALFTESGSAIGGKLTITNDLIIQNGGYYFSRSTGINIGRDLRLQAGAPHGGAFIIDGLAEVAIGRNFINEGMMARLRIAATELNVTFNTNQDAFIYAADGNNRTVNTYQKYSLGVFTFSYLVPASAPLLANEVLRTGAFDKIIINKPIKVDGTAATIQNSGSAAALSTSNVYLPFMAGIVGDGVNDFDGGGIDERNKLYIPGGGSLNILAGTLIVSDITSTINNNNNRLVAVPDIVPAAPDNFYVYDNTTNDPRGNAWEVPLADINIRGSVTIANANIGTSTYNGASLDLYSSVAAANKKNITMHLGGSLTDQTPAEPAVTPTARCGFYIGPSNMNTTAYQARPVLVFNGNIGQDINGFVPNLRDYNDVPNMGQGILLPNVIVFKRSSNAVERKVNIGNTSNIRIAGDLTIFAGEFNTNARSLIVGDNADDEVNVLALGDKDNATPNFHGYLSVAPGSTLLVASTSAGSNGAALSRGVIIRGRRGGYLLFIGTASNPIQVTRDSRVGGRIRLAVYHGGVISAYYTTFEFPSFANDGTGSIIGYALTTGTPATTNTPNDDNFYTTGGREGGYKALRGAILLQPAAGVDCFSFCTFNAANENVNLTIDTDWALNFGQAYGSQTQRNIIIENTSIEGSPPQNRGVISKLNADYTAATQDQSAIGYSATLAQDYVVIMKNSLGPLGGTNGEANDDDDGSSTGAIDDRILWDNAPIAVWQGDVSTDWDNWQNWSIPATACPTCPNNADLGNGLDAANLAANPNKLVPGKNGFTNINVKIPSNAVRNSETGLGNFVGVLAGVTYTLNGSIEINTGAVPGSERRLVLQNATQFNIEKDITVYRAGHLDAKNANIYLKGSLLARDERKNEDYTNPIHVSNFNAETSTVHIIGTETQNIQVRHNPFYNLIIDKPSGLAVFQGYNSGADRNQVYTLRVNNKFELKNGHARLNSFTPMDIRGDYIQTGGIFEPLASQVTIRGNYNATAGQYIAGQGVLQFYPLKNSSTTKTIRATGQTFNDIVIGDGDNIDLTSNDPNIMQTNRQTLQMGYMLIRFEDNTGQPYRRNHVYDLVAGTSDSTGTSASNPIFTYNLLTDLNTTGTITVRGNRVLNNDGHVINANDVNLNWRSKLSVTSTRTATGELRIASGKKLTVRSNARLDMIGLTSRFVKLTRSDNIGRFSTEIGGMISMRYYIAEFMDEKGINLTSTAVPISPGTIKYGGGGQNYTSPTVSFTSLYSGVGASVNATVSGTPVISIDVINQGTGYTSAPTVTFTGGNPAVSTLTATATMEGSPITGVSIIDGGTGYTGTPTVTFSNPTGTPAITATGTAIMEPAKLASITLTDPGSGYTRVPTITVTGLGTGAIAVANLNPSGIKLQTLAMVAGGSGYAPSSTIPNAITVSGGAGTGAVGSITTNASGEVTAVNITASGSGYTFPITIEVVGGGGSGAIANVSTLDVIETSLSSIDVIEGGSGYTAAPTITIDAPTGSGPVTATATSTVSTGGGKVIGVAITNPGNGYLTAPTVTFAGGGATTDASAIAFSEGGRVSAITINTNQNFITLPDVTLTGGGGAGALAKIYGNGGEITGFTGLVAGTNYRTAPVVTITDPGIGTGATAYAKVGPVSVNDLNVLAGGSGYTTPGTIVVELLSANGDGPAVLDITANVTITTTGAPDHRILTMTLSGPVGGGVYTTAPKVRVTGGGGTGVFVKALLQPTQLQALPNGVFLAPLEVFPVASFSNGIFTNTAGGTGAANRGAALTIDGAAGNYRDKPNTNTDEDNLVGGLTPTAAGVTHDYGAPLGAGAGPRVDTVYNVIFAQNPIADGANPLFTHNVYRSGTNNNAQNRIVFKDAIGAFSGEDNDFEDAITAVAAGTPNNYLNPNGISASDSMVVWREPNVKRWDGGPNGTGTAWNDDANWRPDGIPQDFHDIIIDYSLMWVDYTTTPPTLKVPTININMNHNYTGFSTSSGKSMTINPLILPQIAGTGSTTQEIQVTMNETFRIGGTIAVTGGEKGIINGNPNYLMQVGESWSNNGRFNHNQNTVEFYKNASRTIVSGVEAKDAGNNNNLPNNTNAFYNVKFTEGVTDLSTDILAQGNLTIGQTGTLSAGAGNNFIFLEADWINQGIFQPQNGTVYFRGNSLQRVRKIPNPLPADQRSIKEDFFNMVVYMNGLSTAPNSANNVKLENRLEIKDLGRITFVNGLILSEPNKEFIIAENASISGTVSEASFVQGPVGRIFSSAGTPTSLYFPIGSEKGAGKDANITVTTVNATTGAIETFTINTPGTGYSVGNKVYVNSITGSSAEYTVASVDGAGGITGLTMVNAGRNYVVGEVMEVPKGQSDPVYVGNNEGALQLVGLTLNSPQKTMFVAEQIETAPPGTKIIPSASNPPINYISRDRHWTVRNLPYVESGNITSAANADLNSTQVKLFFKATEENLFNPITSTTSSGDLQLVDIGAARIFQDSHAPFNATSGTAAGYSPNDATTHNTRSKRGTAYPSSYWKDLGASGSPSVSVATPIELLSTGTIDSLNDGVFVIGLEYLPLPLEVIEVNATAIDKEVLVSWTTINETTSQRFIVERSFDGNTFEPIGTVEAKGATARTSILRYEFMDTSPQIGINYYRLKQVEFSGSEELTKVVSANVTEEKTFVVYPNPNLKGGVLNIAVPAELGEQVSLQLIDVQGRVVKIENQISDGTIVTMQLPETLTEGFYLLNVETANNRYQAKIILK